ncbi:MAG: fasciclin domain-containing protein [Solirubrobacterales bacterium]
MAKQADAKRGSRQLKPLVLSLEGRVLPTSGMMSSVVRPAPLVGATQPSQAALSIIDQVYLNVLGRSPTATEATNGARVIDRGGNGVRRVLVNLFHSSEYQTNTVNSIYNTAFGRAPTSSELNAALNVFRRTGSSRAVELSVYSSPAFFQTAGGTNADYVSALYSRILNRLPDSSSSAYVDRLGRGASRSSVARAILNSTESNQLTVNELYGRYLYRNADPSGLSFYSQSLARGNTPESVVISLILSPEYRNATSNVGTSIVSVAAGNPDFSTLVTAVQAAGLADLLSGPGPFTVFAPTNEAFAQLPAGTLQSLLNNPTQLRSLLLYHVVPGVLSGPQVQAQGVLTTAEGQNLGVSGGTSGTPLAVGGAKVLGTVRAGNGVIHVIDTVLTIPTQNIVGVAAGNPNFSTLVTAVQKAGLVSILQGPGPFTIFAPTNAAFAQLPAGTLQSLLNNPSALRSVLLYHAVPGALSTSALATRGTLATADGPTVQSQNLNGHFVVDQSNIIIPNVIATNGVIHAIDRVLIPPT